MGDDDAATQSNDDIAAEYLVRVSFDVEALHIVMFSTVPVTIIMAEDEEGENCCRRSWFEGKGESVEFGGVLNFLPEKTFHKSNCHTMAIRVHVTVLRVMAAISFKQLRAVLFYGQVCGNLPGQ